MAHTFQVGNKPIPEYFAKHRPQMKSWTSFGDVMEKVEGKTLYASETQTVGGNSPLFNAVSYAFNNHVPLVLSPDSVWLTILTGLTHHIDTDPEGLRHNFVSHEGKTEIKVRLKTLDWEVAIGLFSEAFKEKLNPKRQELLISSFSTTTPTDLLSSQVAVMGAMKHYFEYKVMLLCDMTKVTILGTPADWENIINRVQVLSEFGLTWWTDHLLPVLQQFKSACAGNPDNDFWARAYLRHRKGSGGQSDVSGWVNALYPYISGGKKMQRNACVDWSKGGEVDPDDFPFGLVFAPVELNDNGAISQCKFYGGLVGVSMAEDFSVKPESGIAVQELEG